MIDTHSHIDGPEFAADINEVILRAKTAGVEKIYVPAIDLKGLPNLIDTCQHYPKYLFPMIGLHPEEVKEDYNDILKQLYTFLKNDKSKRFIAVGEVGLDFYWDDTFKSQQLDALEQQIHWAIEFNLPLMLHVRKAYNEVIELLERHRKDNLRGVFHCFSASKEIAEHLLSFPNFMLGIGGVLTFKNSNLPEVLKAIVPLSRIVLETDSPYMAPIPYRGKRNESAFIFEVAKKLSEVYNCKIEEISLQTNKNCNIFT
ncbi:MAG: TatD family hydrolase [Prevotellaceae bacterium]|nr:TatD family hydrolase [Candidatus Colivivens equi]